MDKNQQKADNTRRRSKFVAGAAHESLDVIEDAIRNDYLCKQQDLIPPFPFLSRTPSAPKILFFSLVNFEPSKVRLYIKPFWLKTNPTAGSLIFSVSMEAAAPRLIRATDPSTPAFQPELARNLARASSYKRRG
ncbi:MAG: hypothetical protein IPI25_14595 [Candidatus Brocadia sp.]|nr:MAG: hypothetical protein IPI25_14595 [Candidatus Brocadia sp.]